VLNFTAIDLQLYKKCESHFWETYSSLKKILHNCQHAARHHNQCTACSITLTCCHRDAVHHSVLSVRHAASQASPHYAARQICKSCNYNERTGAISHHYYNTTTVYSCCKGNCRTASTDCPRRKYGRNTLSRQTKKTMAQQHRRLDEVQVYSAKGDVSGQRAMEEEDTSPTLGGGRPIRERVTKAAKH